MTERPPGIPLPKLLTCSLCGKETRSVYSLPGERKAKFCASCFFGITLASPRYPVCDYCGRAITPTIRHNGGTFTPTTCTEHADLPRLDPMREATK